MRGAPRIFCICHGDHCTSSLAIPSWVTSSHLQLGQFSPKKVSLLWFGKQSKSRLGSLPPYSGCPTPCHLYGAGTCQAARRSAVPAGMCCSYAPFPPESEVEKSLLWVSGQPVSPSSLEKVRMMARMWESTSYHPGQQTRRRGSIQSKLKTGWKWPQVCRVLADTPLPLPLRF